MKNVLMKIKSLVEKDIIKREPERFPVFALFGFIGFALISGPVYDQLLCYSKLTAKKKDLINSDKYIL